MGRSPSSMRRRSFELTAEHPRYVDQLIADSAFATGSEVVNAGLQALREREGDVERWLREEVVPTCDRMQADPSRGLPADEVRRRLRVGHEETLRAESRCNES